jgi:hypothetical protein
MFKFNLEVTTHTIFFPYYFWNLSPFRLKLLISLEFYYLECIWYCGNCCDCDLKKVL